MSGALGVDVICFLEIFLLFDEVFEMGSSFGQVERLTESAMHACSSPKSRPIKGSRTRETKQHIDYHT